MCGNVLLIDLDQLAEEGLIDKEDLPEALPVTTAQFDKVSLCPAQSLRLHWRLHSSSVKIQAASIGSWEAASCACQACCWSGAWYLEDFMAT